MQEVSLVSCSLGPQRHGGPLWRTKKQKGEGGRLKLFVPGREDRQLHSRLVLRSGLHSVPCQEEIQTS